MKKRGILLIFLLSIVIFLLGINLFTINAIGHESDSSHDEELNENNVHEELNESDVHEELNESDVHKTTWIAVLIGTVGLAIFTAIVIIWQKKLTKKAKKILFVGLCIIILGVTIYLGASTIYLNIISETKGPVHWHADYEIWLCGKQIELSNTVGTPLLHEHNDNRIHIEGVPIKAKEVALQKFFQAIGGDLSNDLISVPTNENIIIYKNRDLCNGKPANLYVFVNGKQIENPADYVISPHSKVPPGDTIKIIFTEKNPSEINPYIATYKQK